MNEKHIKLLAEHMVNNPIINVWDKYEAVSIIKDRNVESEQDYTAILQEFYDGKPAVAPHTYTPKPPGDDTPQWIWDHYKNGGRTS